MSADFLVAPDWSRIDEVNEDGKVLILEGPRPIKKVEEVLLYMDQQRSDDKKLLYRDFLILSLGKLRE